MDKLLLILKVIYWLVRIVSDVAWCLKEIVEAINAKDTDDDSK